MDLRHGQPFTLLSLALTTSGILLSLSDAGAMGPALLCLAQVCALAEFKKYTGRAQFAMILVSALALGIVLDLRTHAMGAYTTPLLLGAVSIVLRQAYMSRLTYVRHLWLEPVMVGVALMITAFNWSTQPFQWWSALLPLVTLSAATFLACSYVQDGRMMKRRTRNGYRVLVDSPAPDLVPPDQDGNSVRLSDYRGKHPVLLIFVRGDWCPGCHMMLRTYARHHERFKARGVHVLGIGPDSVDVNRDMVERIGVDYRLLSDSEQTISTRYGVVYDNAAIEAVVNYAEGIPLPASFLVDIDGIVRYVSRPDRAGEFLDPSLIFGVLERLPGNDEKAWKAA